MSSIKNDGFRHFDVAQTFEEHSERHTKQNVTTYHAFHTTKVMLLLVVFRYQQGNFWWHGKFDGNVSWNANLNDFDAVKREGAYDK